VSELEKKKTETFVTLLGLTTEEGSYCMSEYRIPKAIFQKYCEKVSRTEPEQFAVLRSQIIEKARELLEI